MSASSDRIEREIQLKAPRSNAWNALADAPAFGAWFGVALGGQQFQIGAKAKGQITHTGYAHHVWEVQVERLEPKRLMSFSWHPFAVESGIDYSREPCTLVEFHLQAAPGGCLLRVVESGFDGIPLARRAKALEMHCSGWDQQMKNIQQYLLRC